MASVYTPSNEERDITREILEHFDDSYVLRSLTYRLFGTKHDPSEDLFVERDLQTFIEDSEKRFLSYKDVKAQVTPGQFRMAMPITHDQVIALYAQFMARNLTSELSPTNQFNLRAISQARILELLDKVFDERDGTEGGLMQLAQKALSCAVRGTLVTHRGFRMTHKKGKDILEYNPATLEGKYKEYEETVREIYSEIIPLERIYFGSLWESDIQRQPYIIHEELVPESSFRVQFAKHSKIKHIQGYSEDTRDYWFFNEQPRAIRNVKNGDVHLLRYFSKNDYTFHLLVNGILFTPLVSPFYSKHKKYPYSLTQFEPLDPDGRFVYGNNLPNKLMDNQDVVNIIWNMVLTQMAKALSSIVMTGSLSDLTDEIIGPAGISMYKVQDPSSVKNLTFPAPDQSAYNILEYANRSIETSGLSAQEQGVGGVRAKTATESLRESEKSEEVQSAFIKSMGNILRQETELRVSDILQYMLEPTIIKTIEGEKEIIKEPFLEFILNNSALPSGDEGTVIMRINEDVRNLSDNDRKMRRFELNQEVKRYYRDKKNVHIIEFSPQLFADIFQFVVKIDTVSAPNRSRSLKLALFNQFITQVFTYFPDKVNRDFLFKRLVELYDENPEDMTLQGNVMPPGYPPTTGGNGMTNLNRQILEGARAPSLTELTKKV